MPRKAKPLRMWIIEDPSGFPWLETISFTREGATLGSSGGKREWAHMRKVGFRCVQLYRAVRVTVREEV